MPNFYKFFLVFPFDILIFYHPNNMCFSDYTKRLPVISIGTLSDLWISQGASEVSSFAWTPCFLCGDLCRLLIRLSFPYLLEERPVFFRIVGKVRRRLDARCFLTGERHAVRRADVPIDDSNALLKTKGFFMIIRGMTHFSRSAAASTNLLPRHRSGG